MSVAALDVGMETGLISEGDNGAILQASPESEWLRSDTVADLEEWL